MSESHRVNPRASIFAAKSALTHEFLAQVAGIPLREAVLNWNRGPRNMKPAFGVHKLDPSYADKNRVVQMTLL